MNHFDYLVKDNDAGFFGGGMDKTAATVGGLVSQATNGGIARAARAPRAAEVLAPRFRRVQKLASPAAMQTELELLKVAHRGRFAMTKAAAELMAELESDDQASEAAKDAAFNVIFASAIHNDIQRLKLAMPEAQAFAIGREMLKAAGVIGELAEGAGKLLGRTGAREAEEGIARTGAKALARGVGKAEGAAPKVLAAKPPVALPKSPMSATPRAEAIGKAVDKGERLTEGTSVTKKIDMNTVPKNNIPRHDLGPGRAATKVLEHNAGQGGAAASAAAHAGEGAEQGGYMNSLNKFMRGEQLEPHERAHVFKLGLGALGADRLLTHMNEGGSD